MTSLLTEYDEKKVRKLWRLQDKAEGLAEGRAEGLAEGRVQGQDLISRLILALLADNRLEDIERIAKDRDYQEQLLQEYKLI